jgi:F-type H+-transporting ATPase subunit delta
LNQISKEYAGALFSLALEQGCVRKWADELKVMLDALEEQPAYVQLLSSPEIPGEERAELLGKAFGGELSREPLSFAALMCRRGRARELPDAIRRFRDMADEAERIKHARVTSAFPLSEEEQERLRQRLSGISEGAVVVLECRVDPRLIGGVMVEMDGRILDGTVRTKLREIKEVIGG